MSKCKWTLLCFCVEHIPLLCWCWSTYRNVLWLRARIENLKRKCYRMSMHGVVCQIANDLESLGPIKIVVFREYWEFSTRLIVGDWWHSIRVWNGCSLERCCISQASTQRAVCIRAFQCYSECIMCEHKGLWLRVCEQGIALRRWCITTDCYVVCVWARI